jgi:tetratricopeptide (TPR) repeat protein
VKLYESPLRSARVAAVFSAGLAALVYANSLRNDFAYDDVHIIQENPDLQSLETLPRALIEPYWPGEFAKQLGLWRPTTTAVLGVEYAVSGKDPLLYHFVNVLAHALTTALVVLVLSELMSLAAAFFGGVVFAVHPVHVEAVANVIGIAELLPAALFLVAVLIHLRGPDRTGWGRALAIGGLYAVAFGAKESAVTLPGVLFLVDAARRRIGFGELPDYVRRRWRPYLAMVVVAVVMVSIRFRILGSVAHPFAPLGADLLEEIPRIWTLSEVWSHYVRLLVFPMDLSADYSPNVIPISTGWHAANLVGLILTLGLLVGSIVAWRRPEMARGSATPRALAFGVVWFMIVISPVSNVLFLSGVLLAERNLYLPSVGFAAAFGWFALWVARERPRLSWVLVTAAVSLMGWRTWTRNPTWRDNTTVFGRMIADYPHSGRSQWVLGGLFFQRGRPKQGLVSYRAAINILGAHYPLLVEISRELIAAQYYYGAERLLLQAWQAHPELPSAPTLLAVVYSEEGKPEETERFCRIALALDDTDAVPHHLLAWALAEQGRWREAEEARQGAIAHGESEYWQQWVSLAYLRHQAGDTTAAKAALDSALVRAHSTYARRQVDSLREAFRGLPSTGQVVR